jgi:hypothetical protein
MDPLSAVVVPWLGEWATVLVAGLLLSSLSAKLNPKDSEKALKIASKDSQEQEEGFLLLQAR